MRGKIWPVSYHSKWVVSFVFEHGMIETKQVFAFRQNMNKVLRRVVSVFNTWSGMALNIKRDKCESISKCVTCVCFLAERQPERQGHNRRNREREPFGTMWKDNSPLCKRVTSKSAIRTEIPNPINKSNINSPLSRRCQQQNLQTKCARMQRQYIRFTHPRLVFNFKTGIHNCSTTFKWRWFGCVCDVEIYVSGKCLVGSYCKYCVVFCFGRGIKNVKKPQ